MSDEAALIMVSTIMTTIQTVALAYIAAKYAKNGRK